MCPETLSKALGTNTHRSPFQVAQAKLFSYQIPFKSKMQFNTQALLMREGLLLRLTDTDGQHRFAEIAPLPGFSKESLSEVKSELFTLLNTGINQLYRQHSQHKSIQYALDYLFISNNQITKKTGKALPACADSIPLLQGNTDAILKQYQALGHPTLIKLKVARQDVQYDIEVVQQLSAINPNLKIRCDANQSWRKAQVDQFFKKVNSQAIDYIEEPTKNHHDNLQLAERFNFYIGLDETLQQDDFIYQHHPRIKALIIKPCLIGSLNKIDNLVSMAQQYLLQVNLSSSFESIVGLSQLKHLACHYLATTIHQKDSLFLGIDTLKFFNGKQLIKESNIEHDCNTLECLWESH